MMMTTGFFRLIPYLPKIFLRYPMSCINNMSWARQAFFFVAVTGAKGQRNKTKQVQSHMIVRVLTRFAFGFLEVGKRFAFGTADHKLSQNITL
nr:ABC transporter G family member 12-like [Tanacetum cinerariifolium]